MRYLLVSTILILSSLAGGCANYYVIPESLDQKIDRTVTFADLKQNPEKYKGKTVALGGLVLRAKHLKEGTQIEVLQIPLSRSDRPDYTTEASEGRFLLLDPEHHDPAVLQNHRITVVGEVIGQRVQTIDESPTKYFVVATDHDNLEVQPCPLNRFGKLANRPHASPPTGDKHGEDVLIESQRRSNAALVRRWRELRSGDGADASDLVFRDPVHIDEGLLREVGLRDVQIDLIGKP